MIHILRSETTMLSPKIILIVVSAILLASVSAIVLTNAGGGTEDVNEMIVEKSIVSDGQRIEVNAGDDAVISLEANNMTGYSWTIRSSDGLEMTKDWYVVEKGKENLCGAGGTQYFQFHCEKAGTYKIVLDYQRPWESESVKTFTVDVVVS